MSLYAKICTQNVCVVVVVVVVVVVSGESFSYCVGLTKKKIIIIINRKKQKIVRGFLFLLLVSSFKISRIDQNSERPYNLRHPNY